jgi:hypothetical protein
MHRIGVNIGVESLLADPARCCSDAKATGATGNHIRLASQWSNDFRSAITMQWRTTHGNDFRFAMQWRTIHRNEFRFAGRCHTARLRRTRLRIILDSSGKRSHNHNPGSKRQAVACCT